MSHISTAYGTDPFPGKTKESRILEGYVFSDTNRPVDSDDKQSIPVFYNDTGKLYAVTKIPKTPNETHLRHLWFLRDQIILDSKITFKEDQIKGVSGLILKPNWVGKWRVDVTDDDGTLLYSIPFIIQKKTELEEISNKPAFPKPEASLGKSHETPTSAASIP